MLLQYGSKSNSLSPKPSDMQPESWLNSHISVHSKTVTALLTISNSRVEKKAPPTVLKNRRISGKQKVQRDTQFVFLSFTNSHRKKLNVFKPSYDHESIKNRLSKHNFSSYPPLTQFPSDNYLLYFIFFDR